MSSDPGFAEALAARVRGSVRTDEVTRALYATDASLYEITPQCVLVAAETDDLAAAVETCREYRVPITARGAGTSLAGQAVGAGLVIDCSRLRRAVEVGEERARVEPGVVLDRLNSAVPGRWFGPDTATSDRCTIGGMIGNNSCGARSLVYGTTVDHVESLEVVLADGTRARLGPGASLPGSGVGAAVAAEAARIASEEAGEVAARFPRIPRRVSGYNLDRLCAPDPNLASVVVGSEGTLALVAEATLRLVPRPLAVAAGAFHFASMDAALEAARDLGALGPAAVELLDRMLIGLARDSLGYARSLSWLRGDPDAVLLVEFFGESHGQARGRMGDAERLVAGRAGAGEVVRLADDARGDAWRVRKAGLPLLYALPGPRRPLPFVEDTAVAPERVPEYVAAFREVVARYGTSAAFYAHAAAGCLHVRPLLDPSQEADLRAMVSMQREIASLVRSFGGAMSGEHGDGLARSHLLEELFGPRIVAAFASLKRAFDPEGLLNPGKIVDPPSPIEDLRRSPADRPVALTAALAHPGGLPGAAERCFGAGVCLKTASGGGMCPSYMVTREEDDSTRARANALRAVMLGRLPVAALAGERVARVMDLCVGCKACKAECPAGVDVAALRIEVLAQRYARGRPPPRARLFARTHDLARLGAALPAAANLLARAAGPAVRARLGLRRPFPRLARTRFSGWAARRPRRSGEPVTLFVDTFTEFFAPEQGRAAVAVLEAAGYSVRVLAGACCGRPALSQGIVGLARRQARGTASALTGAAGTVVFLEPSCYSAVADDYPLLDVRLPSVELRTFDDFVAENAPRFAPVLRPSEEEALLHVHCHQRALRGVSSALDAARLGGAARFVDAGCCGMAGSFGYEREHADISRAMGERVLMPAARAHDGPVVAAGFSCREQIAAGARRPALHPAELLARRLR